MSKEKETLTKKVEAQAIVHQQYWTSPLPPPEVLHSYEAISPNVLNTLMHIVENRNAHNIAMEKSAQEAQLKVRLEEEKTRRLTIHASLVGKLVGALIALAGFALSGLAMYLGHPVVATILCGGELLSLVIAIMYAPSLQPKHTQLPKPTSKAKTPEN